MNGELCDAAEFRKNGTSRACKTFRIGNVGFLSFFESGSTVAAESLENRGLIPHGRSPVKLLGEGDAPSGVTVKVHRASAGARQKIEAAGGSVEVIG